MNKKIPMRRCAGCSEAKPKRELIRITMLDGGGVAPDPTGRAHGRGVYLCIGKKECFEAARKKKALARSLHAEISNEELDALAEKLLEYEK